MHLSLLTCLQLKGACGHAGSQSRRTTGNPFADEQDEQQEDALDLALHTYSDGVPHASVLNSQAASNNLSLSPADAEVKAPQRSPLHITQTQQQQHNNHMDVLGQEGVLHHPYLHHTAMVGPDMHAASQHSMQQATPVAVTAAELADESQAEPLPTVNTAGAVSGPLNSSQAPFQPNPVRQTSEEPDRNLSGSVQHPMSASDLPPPQQGQYLQAATAASKGPPIQGNSIYAQQEASAQDARGAELQQHAHSQQPGPKSRPGVPEEPGNRVLQTHVDWRPVLEAGTQPEQSVLHQSNSGVLSRAAHAFTETAQAAPLHATSAGPNLSCQPEMPISADEDQMQTRQALSAESVQAAQQGYSPPTNQQQQSNAGSAHGLQADRQHSQQLNAQQQSNAESAQGVQADRQDSRRLFAQQEANAEFAQGLQADRQHSQQVTAQQQSKAEFAQGVQADQQHSKQLPAQQHANAEFAADFGLQSMLGRSPPDAEEGAQESEVSAQDRQKFMQSLHSPDKGPKSKGLAKGFTRMRAKAKDLLQSGSSAGAPASQGGAVDPTASDAGLSRGSKMARDVTMMFGGLKRPANQ